MVPLKYLSNFWRPLEMPLIDCEITTDLNWSENCVIVATNIANQGATFSITDAKLSVPVVTLDFLFYHLKMKHKEQVTNDIIFQLKKEKSYNVMIDEQNFFDQSLRNNLITYDNIRKIPTGQGGDYTTGCLLDYNYFESYYKMIVIDLSKQQALDSDPKAMQQINFTGNLGEQSTIFFIIEEAKEKVLDFSQGTEKVF